MNELTANSSFMNILVACEESQIVASAFRAKGHNAFSCDVLDCSGGHPEYHIKSDVIPLLNGFCSFQTCSGDSFYISSRWDLIIAFPPCTYLTVTGNRWFNIARYGDKAIERFKKREEAISFFKQIFFADCNKICIENPIGIMSKFCRPSQYIQPYFFGDAFEKRTCLWLKNLSNLKPTNLVAPPPRSVFASGVTMPTWYAYMPSKDRAKNRSKTFPGLAVAMANQWG